MVDGGSENNNQQVDSALAEPTVSIRKIIAQKDIHFSNSIIESVNKIVKYRQLYLYDIPDFRSLEKHLDRFVPVYNNIRPHISLGGLTPKEALLGIKLNKEQIRDQFQEAREERIRINRQYSCGICSK